MGPRIGTFDSDTRPPDTVDPVVWRTSIVCVLRVDSHLSTSTVECDESGI